MAKSKADIMVEGAEGFAQCIANPYKEGSWQFMAWASGYSVSKHAAYEREKADYEKRIAAPIVAPKGWAVIDTSVEDTRRVYTDPKRVANAIVARITRRRELRAMM